MRLRSTDAGFGRELELAGLDALISRGAALTIDSGWREVADTALEFVRRFSTVQ